MYVHTKNVFDKYFIPFSACYELDLARTHLTRKGADKAFIKTLESAATTLLSFMSTVPGKKKVK